MSYVGKVCPYCKSEFKEDDEVVICSVCEMPHHKECWIENKACTTFGCTGTIMGTGNNSDGVICDRCGLVYFKGEAFCSACGNALRKSEQQEQNSYTLGQPMPLNYNQSQYTNPTLSNANSYNNESNIDMQNFIGKNLYYFLNKFQDLNRANEKVSWNWASAFLGGYWYAYRKMYLNQLIFYGIWILGSCIPLLWIATIIVSGMFGNYIYKCNAEKHVQIAKNMDYQIKESYLKEKGGTSSGAVWAVIGIRVAIVFLVILMFIQFSKFSRIH
ncbi:MULTISPECIES: RING finger protein [unclassified Clostridium]|uniref:RING finger protein n=1 Tax=unclassified Clostridium TaxID=2614128 RepID=UPI000297F308|nr:MULTISPECIES: RING finger protein [unclassified Clostridium]EKQ57914.1 MAG: Protein of unknown function (DUF2628) [Clostridium sp. Maddingley MBC34-26]